MKKIGLFYSHKTNKTSIVAEKVARAFGEKNVDKLDIETIDAETFLKYDNLVLGLSTWFDGELPQYWDEFLPSLENINLDDKKIGIFTLGDQKSYPQNFGDAIGIIADLMEDKSAHVYGKTSTEGYTYERSLAAKGAEFLGLIIDFENQKDLTDERVEKWVEGLKKEFK